MFNEHPVFSYAHTGCPINSYKQATTADRARVCKFGREKWLMDHMFKLNGIFCTTTEPTTSLPPSPSSLTLLIRLLLHAACFVSSTGCSLNIVFFSKDFKIFRTLAFLCSPSVSVCVENQRLQENFQSSEKSKILRKKNTIVNEHPVSSFLIK